MTPSEPGNPEGALEKQQMTTRTNKKQTNIEGKFFGMIVLAWIALAIVFNIAHSALPQAKAPAAKTATPAATTNGAHAARAGSLG
jgi:hypothetical protein